MKEIEFWFEFASTYSYLAVHRIEDLAYGRNLAIKWRSFLLGPIFAAQGWNDSPFNIYPAKGDYMWRDMERLADSYDLPFQKPTTFPRFNMAAARIAFMAAAEDWCPAFVKAVYSANFADDRATDTDDVIAEILTEISQDAAGIFEAITEPALKDAFKAQNGRASSLGIFGAPSFIVGEELYWGNDRLEQAIMSV